MAWRMTILLGLFLAAPALNGEAFFGVGDLTIALLKEDDALFDERSQPVQEKEMRVPLPVVTPGLTLGTRFGLLYPGPSRDTGTFVTGPDAGGWMRLPLGPGTLEITLDLARFKAPSDVDREYQLMLRAGANYLYHMGDLYVGGGACLANATPLTRMFILRACAGISVYDHADIGLNIYFPLGGTNNRFMLGVSLNYHF